VGGTLTRGQTKKWLQKKLRLCQITDRIDNLLEGSIKYNTVQIFEFGSWDDEVEEKAEIALDFLLEG
jgi:hypothetical protein